GSSADAAGGSGRTRRGRRRWGRRRIRRPGRDRSAPRNVYGEAHSQWQELLSAASGEDGSAREVIRGGSFRAAISLSLVILIGIRVAPPLQRGPFSLFRFL